MKQTPRSLFKKIMLRGALASAIVSLSLVAGIGYLHTPSGKKLPIARKLLTWLGVPCPVGELSAAEVEGNWVKGVRASLGRGISRTRPSLPGLQLGVTTESEAKAWAAQRGSQCQTQVKGVRLLKCEGGSQGKPGEAIVLAFGTTGQLAAVDVFHRGLKGSDAEARLAKLTAFLRQELGRPTDASGEMSANYLSGGPGRTSIVQYRYQNYLALLTATHLPWAGIVLHEQYMMARAQLSRSL